MNRNRLAFEDQTKTLVKLDGKVVGHIKEVAYHKVGEVNVPFEPSKDTKFYQMGYRYYPKGSKTGGEIFATKGECMYSLYDMGND